MKQLKYYINLGAPPIRDNVTGNELFINPVVGFNPSWFNKSCGIDFSEEWHTNPQVRYDAHKKMKNEIKNRFPGYNIGEVLENKPIDLLTGIFGIGIMDSIFERPLKFYEDRWPVPYGEHLTEDEILKLEVPNLNENKFFQSILMQVEIIYKLAGNARGFLNWQGNLNTAFRLRGQEFMIDLISNTKIARRLLNIISDTYLQGVTLLYEKQKSFEIDYQFATVANCTVNMVGPEIYKNTLLEYDKKIAEKFDVIGIHNCAWTATPYLDLYSQIPNVGYIDMGIETDLKKAKEIFPYARRNCLYKSIDLKNKSFEEINKDFEFIAMNLGPCDIGLPDIEMDVPDEKIKFAIDVCKELSEKYE
ncbi:MAG: hypothetical protein H6610_09500 [Ignavibacteriales bacterium]|nr:hypothetical protein [Ignavibacteriales bacterium]MCB9219678.1 hypothetical protein [Ignavibacteriales bacterium]MCB9259812.1 hypothetical protein [Ignavibacteriales bacterium]